MLQSDRAWYEAFNTWEQQCRGWKLWDFAVELEPPFSAIVPTPIMSQQDGDDGRVAGGIRGLLTRNNLNLGQNRFRAPRQLGTAPELVRKPNPFYRTTDVTELQIKLPRDLDIAPAMAEQFLLSLGNFKEPFAFEIFADADAISIQSASGANFANHLRSQWKALFPAVSITERNGFLASQFSGTQPTVVADFGLAQSIVLPLRSFRSFNPDPLTGLISSCATLGGTERTVFQILLQPAKSSWAEELLKIQANADRRKILQDHDPSFSTSLKNKLSSPLFAVNVRLMAQAAQCEKAWEIIRRIGGALRQYGDPTRNELIALSNEGYPENDHRLSVLSRTTYRSGTLLNTSELASLTHLPSSSVRVEKLHRLNSKTKPVPSIGLGHRLVLGANTHDGRTKAVTLSNEQRTRHAHIIGSTGSGKSTLLHRCIVQDIEAGEGVCVIDPHGDLIDAVSEVIPENRIRDTILFDPSDGEFPIGFNILQAHSDLEKTLISSDLVAAFKRMSTSWGDVMDAVLANAVLAILESDRGGTLLDLKRFLVEKDFRNEFLQSVQDEAVRYFWQHEFPLIAGKPQASILIRLDAFLRQKLIRNIVCQKTSKLNFREIMDHKKILLIKLSQGEIGLENSHFLGTLLVTKIHQIALTRQETMNRPFFAIYIDEFHNFVVPSIEGILSGIRKYNIALTLSHQEYRQLQSRNQEVAASVMSNCYTRVCFRLGDADAERFAGGFSTFDASALQNLGIGEAVARIERSDYDFNLKTQPIDPVEGKIALRRRREVIEQSRRTYAAAKTAIDSPNAVSNRPVQAGGFSTQDPPPSKHLLLDRPEETILVEPKVNVGRAGKHHQELQAVIKRIAETYGYRVEIELVVLDGAGRIDVSLEKENLKIACEVSVTTADYEVTNVLKCLAAGYDHALVVVSNPKKLQLIDSKIRASIPIDDHDRVKVLGLMDLFAFLRGMSSPQGAAEANAEKRSGGRLDFVEACGLLGKSPSTLYRWIREGRVPFYRIGREYEFDRGELLLVGKHDLSGKRKANVKLSPLTIEKTTPKTKKEQDERYRKLLKLDKIDVPLHTRREKEANDN